MKAIPLSGGGEAIVDDADHPTISRWRWKRHRHGYACRTKTGGALVLMHRQIMGEPAGLEVDHRNLNKLDNRRENLRVATHSQNGLNKRKQSNNTSGVKGVYYDRARGKWAAEIKVDGKRHRLGRFATIEQAASAYAKASAALCPEFGRTDCVLDETREAVAS